MRIYEYAQKMDVPSKDLIAHLRSAGFTIKSHMSVLTDQELHVLEEKFNKQKQDSTNKIIQLIKKVPSSQPDSEQSGGARAQEGFRIKKSEKITLQEATPLKAPSVVPEQKTKDLIPGGMATPGQIELRPMILSQVAQAFGLPTTEVILTLLRWRILSNKNQMLSEDVIQRLATHYNVAVVKPRTSKIDDQSGLRVSIKKEAGHSERLPVVVILGHVDHGKTTLLDYIRNTRVAAKEKGGITQHLGAYQVDTAHGGLVFLDTPGHEAFSKMRARGVKIADIAIVIIAADDGVMPQTVEAIKQAKAMQVPVVVAINKIDRAEPSRIETIKKDLMKYDVLVEDWGGEVICMPISAKTGKGVNELIEMIALQAQLLELTANPHVPAVGYILEAQMEKGRGPVATMLTQDGSLGVGDFFAAGKVVGKINSMIDSRGLHVQKVGPSVPVRAAGFSELPESGDYFRVIGKEEYKKFRAKKEDLHDIAASQVAAMTDLDAIKLIIKADNNSSKEAVEESILKISQQNQKKELKRFVVVRSGVGKINESDVTFAEQIGAHIIGMHIKPDPAIESFAQSRSVKIFSYEVIYRLLEFLEVLTQGSKKIEMVRKKIGELEVRKVFHIKKVGVVAGCYVKDGRITRESTIEIWRDNQKIGEGKISSLQRDKKTVKEVHAGFECAFMMQGHEDWMEFDKVLSFIEQPK